MTNAGVRVEHRFIVVDGLRLHCLDLGGTGQPIICLHGVTGQAWAWHEVASRLSGLGRFIGLDLRGHGDSQWSADAIYSTQAHVADLAGLIDHLGVAEVDLIGLSWGALVALAFAARNPSRVRRLAIVDVEPSFSQSETDIPPRPRVFDSHADVVAWERSANPHASDAMVQLIASVGTRPGAGGKLERKHDPFFFERWPFRSDDHWDELPALTMPTLIVHAEQSWVRGEVTEQMAHRAPRAELLHVPDSGHLVPVENPAALAAGLEPFLATSPATVA